MRVPTHREMRAAGWTWYGDTSGIYSLELGILTEAEKKRVDKARDSGMTFKQFLAQERKRRKK
jgi:hypothetical protein